jgi:histidine triad (HIT) family protein
MESSRFVEGCAFCSIVRGEDNSVEVVCQADEWVAFFPLHPATPGHTLVIPRTHVADFWAASPELAGALAGAAVNVGRAIESALRPEGMNLITSSGQIAEQSVFHLHLHIVPRWHDDGFGTIWPREERYENAALGDYASKIRQACSTERDRG